MARHVGTIELTWDGSGRLRHSLASVVPMNAEQTSDILAVSVPMLVSGQLGVMRPIYSLALCDRLLHLLETSQYAIEPINSALKSAKMQFYGGNTIYHTFHPSIGFLANNDSVEQAVRQLCFNYTVHVRTQADEEFRLGLDGALTISMLYYLTEGLDKQIAQRDFDPARSSPAVQMTMNEFSRTLYSHWEQNRVPAEKVAEALRETQQCYQDVRQKLNL